MEIYEKDSDVSEKKKKKSSEVSTLHLLQPKAAICEQHNFCCAGNLQRAKKACFFSTAVDLRHGAQDGMGFENI